MSTDGVTISVVIAVRDGEQTIQAAVQSALDQSEPPIEVIVVDDMSTDETRQRVIELASDRVVVLSGEGRGVAAARNSGIRATRGSWIAFLDGDDHWEAGFLESARRRIGSSADAVACFGAAVPIDDHGGVVGRHAMRETVTFEDLLYGRVVPTTSATLVRRDALAACGGFFEGFRSLAGVEDLDLWWRIAVQGRCIGLASPLATYVVHDERDRLRPIDVLLDLERDREMVIDRLAESGLSPGPARRARAIMRARTGRYWLRARRPDYARAAARSSLRARPTLEGLVTLALASLPRPVREGLVRRRRRHRASGVRRGK